jgi:hypothetical protein
MGTPSNTDATSSTENLSDAEQLVNWEKRFKDTQAAYTKTQQKLKETEAKAKVLEELSQPKLELSPSMAEELDDLKYRDPDAWRLKITALETDAHNIHREKLTAAASAASIEAELERRAQVLAEFSSSHPDIILTDDIIQYDVPKRILNKLETGEVTFEAFLDDVYNYLLTPKTFGSANTVLNQPNLTNVGGDSTPTASAISKTLDAAYSKMVF